MCAKWITWDMIPIWSKQQNALSFLVPAIMRTAYNDPQPGGESKRDMQAKMEFPTFCFPSSGFICVDVGYLPGCFSEMRWIQKGFLSLLLIFLFFLSLFFLFFFFFSFPFFFAFHIAFQSSVSVFLWPDGNIKCPLKSLEQNYRWYHFQLKKECNSTVDSTQMPADANHRKLQPGSFPLSLNLLNVVLEFRNVTIPGQRTTGLILPKISQLKYQRGVCDNEHKLVWIVMKFSFWITYKYRT